MKKSHQAIFLILLATIGYLVYDKVTTKPTVLYKESKQAPANGPYSSPQKTEVNRDCLIAADNFFEQKRAADIDLYSATWDAYYEESSGMCFVQINGETIYNVVNGDKYRLEGNTYIKIK